MSGNAVAWQPALPIMITDPKHYTPLPWPEDGNDGLAPDFDHAGNYARARACVIACDGMKNPIATVRKMLKARLAAQENPQEGSWFRPVRNGFKMLCCDCGLVHSLDFKHVSWGRGRKVMIRVRRDNMATAAARKKMKHILDRSKLTK